MLRAGGALVLAASLTGCGIGDRVSLGAVNAGATSSMAGGAPGSPSGGTAGLLGGVAPGRGDGGRAGTRDGGTAGVPERQRDAAAGTPVADGSADGPDSGNDSCALRSLSSSVLCSAKPPAAAFGKPVERWSTVDSAARKLSALTMPIVAPLTDDNGDGHIDGCDVPDVVVPMIEPDGSAHLYFLSGKTGDWTRRFPSPIDPAFAPAAGDLDGDGVPEIVAATPDGYLIAFKSSGVPKWVAAAPLQHAQTGQPNCQSLAIFDLEGDGLGEIVTGSQVFESTGLLRWGLSQVLSTWCANGTAVDLDGDGVLEVVLGQDVYDAQGFLRPPTVPISIGVPMPGNFDVDPEAELAVQDDKGISVLDTGRSVLATTLPTCGSLWPFIGDLDFDGTSEIVVASCDAFGAYGVVSGMLSRRWTRPVVQPTFAATGFDFQGDFIPEIVAAGAQGLEFLDGFSGLLVGEWSPPVAGVTFLQALVADVDGDGSADVLTLWQQGNTTFLSMLSEEGRSWAPARRIWNQAAYTVTNVEEDGTLPRSKSVRSVPPYMYRGNARVEGDKTCKPLGAP